MIDLQVIHTLDDEVVGNSYERTVHHRFPITVVAKSGGRFLIP